MPSDMPTDIPSEKLSRPRRSRPVRRELQPRRRGGSDRGIWIAAAIGLLLAVTIPAASSWYLFRVADPQTVPLLSGTVETTLAADALIVRQEQLVPAPVSGAVRRLVEEGKRVRAGGAVVEITADGATATVTSVEPAQPTAESAPAFDADQDALARQIYQAAVQLNQAAGRGDAAEVSRYQDLLDSLALQQWDLARELDWSVPPASPPTYSPTSPPTSPPTAASAGAPQLTAESAGLVSYQMDGLEEALDPDGAAAWTPSWFKRLPAPKPDRIGVGNVEQGEAVFKLADPLSIGFLAVLPVNGLPVLEAGDRVQVRIAGAEGQVVTAKVSSLVKEGEEALLYLTSSVFPESLTALRKVRATLVFAIYDGKVAPRTALDVRAGVQGVWVREGQEDRFEPVKVLGGNNTHVALETDLPDGARILKVAPAGMQ